MLSRRRIAVRNRPFGALAFRGALSVAVFCAAVLAAVIPESRAQVPPDLVRGPGEFAPDGYNAKDPRFREFELCRNLGGRPADDDDNVCVGIDQAGTFCIVGSADAFPCRGLFKHVLECNGTYNRPALNPFLCAAVCAGDSQKALGGKCLTDVSPAFAEAQRSATVAFRPGDGIVLARADENYTLALPDNLQYAGQDAQAARMPDEREAEQFTREPDIVSTVTVKLSCDECYPEPLTMLAEYHNPVTAELRSAAHTATATAHTVMVTQWVASEIDQPDAVETLLLQGVNARDENGQTPLHYAASLNASLLAEKLLENGADIDAADNAGQTPLDLALETESAGAQAVLLAKNAKCRATNTNPQCPATPAPTPPTAPSPPLPPISLLEKRADNAAQNPRLAEPTGATVLAVFSCVGCQLNPVTLLVEFNNPDGAGHHSESATLTVASAEPVTATAWVVAERGDLSAAEALLARGVNARDGAGQTPLHYAAIENADKLAARLLNRGALVNPINNANQTPLDLAIDNQSAALQTILLRRGGFCIANSGDPCPDLRQLTEDGNWTQVSILLQGGAPVNAANASGDTPLHLAAKNGHSDIAALLLDFNAEVNPTNNDDKTPLDLAIEGGETHDETETILLRAGGFCATNSGPPCPDLHQLAADGNAAQVSLLLKNGAAVNATNAMGDTPLHSAARSGQSTVAALLLENGAAVNPKNNDDKTPLDLAVEGGETHSETQAVIGEHGGFCAVSAGDACASLHGLALAGDADAVVLLLRNGADINALDDENKTALDRAFENDSEGDPRQTRRFLIGFGAYCAVSRDSLCPGLAQVALYGNFTAVTVLLARDETDANAQDDLGVAALHWAAAGEARIVSVLLAGGASVNLKDDNGDAPLHYAARYGNAAAAALLLDEDDAEVNPENDAGETPLDVAVLRGPAPGARPILIENGGLCLAAGHSDCPNLHQLAMNGNAALVSLLLINGAPVNELKDGKTPLDRAIESGDGETQNIIRQYGGFCAASDDENVCPDLHQLAFDGNAAQVSVLLENGAPVNELKEGKTPLDRAIDGGDGETQTVILQYGGFCAVNSGDPCPDLHQLAFDGNAAQVSALLTSGAPVNKLKDGKTPLDFAIDGGDGETQTVIVQLGGYCVVHSTSPCPDLFSAATEGDAVVVVHLLDGGADVNATVAAGDAPLHYAAGAGHADIVSILLTRGASVNAVNLARKTPLDLALATEYYGVIDMLHEHGAVCASTRGLRCPNLHSSAAEGNLALVSVLLEVGADTVDAENSFGVTPMRLAASNGHSTVVLFLLENGANIDRIDADRNTPLHFAARNGRPTAALVLLTSGAKVNPTNIVGQTPLDLAVGRSHHETQTVLIQNGGLCEISRSNVCPDLHRAAFAGDLTQVSILIFKGGLNVNARDENGKTPLDRAVDGGLTGIHTATQDFLISIGGVCLINTESTRCPNLHRFARFAILERVSVLVVNGVDVNGLDDENKTPLDLAFASAHSGAAEVRTFLIESGGVCMDSAHQDCPTLHSAAFAGRLTAVAALLARGAEVNALDDNGKTPLDRAVDGDGFDAVFFLIDNGGVCAVNQGGDCPTLHDAAFDGDFTAVSVLLDFGADINARTGDGKTPLDRAVDGGHDFVQLFLADNGGLCAIHRGGFCRTLHDAAANNDLAAVTLLLSYGASVNATIDSGGETPLHRAARGGYSTVAATLLASGAEVNAENAADATPLDLAIAANSPETQSVIIASGGLCSTTPLSRRECPDLHSAAANGNTVVAAILLDKGAELNGLDDEGKTPLDRALENEPSTTRTLMQNFLINRGAFCAVSEDMACPDLHQLAEDDNNLAQVTLLLANGAPINGLDDEGNTPLDRAVLGGAANIRVHLLRNNGACVTTPLTFNCDRLHNHAFEGNLNRLAALLETGMDVNLLDADGNTPLDRVFQGGVSSAQVWNLIIGYGGICRNVSQETAPGCPDLHSAASLGNLTAAAALLAMGAEINGLDGVGRTPLDLAFEGGHLEMQMFLIDNGGLCETRSDDDCPGNLHSAAMDGDLAVLTVLLAVDGADVNAKNASGFTPLHLAAGGGHELAASVLLASGASVNARDDSAGRTPLDETFFHRRAEARTILLAFGGVCAVARDDDCPDFHTAVTDGNLMLMTALAEVGAPINELKDGKTPLDLAFELGDSAAAARDFLLRLGGVCRTRGDALCPNLHRLSYDGDVNRASILLENGADVNKKNNGGKTPLDRAIEGVQPETQTLIIRYGGICAFHAGNDACPDLHESAADGVSVAVLALLAGGATVNALDGDGKTPLDLAVAGGHSAAQTILISHGGVCSAANRGEGCPDLHGAAAAGNVSVIVALLSAGADVNGRDGRRETPLHPAAENGRIMAASVLLSAGAAINVTNNSHQTPADWAYIFGHSEMLDFLIRRGGSCATIPHSACPGFHGSAGAGNFSLAASLAAVVPDVDIRDAAGDSALHLAAGGGHLMVVSVLLSLGADANAEGSLRRAPLHRAAEGGHSEVLSTLLAEGASVNAKSRLGYTPLDLAAAGGHSAAQVILISHGGTCARGGNDCPDLHEAALSGDFSLAASLLAIAPDVDVRNGDGDSPLHLAAAGGHLMIVSILLSLGADANAEGFVGRTPLHRAAEGGYAEVLSTLLAGGATVGARDNFRRTPLYMAASSGDADAVLVLLAEDDVEVNGAERYGLTPLHVAAYGGHSAAVSILLTAGADVNATSTDDETPLDMAIIGEESETQTETQTLLKNAGGRCGIAVSPVCPSTSLRRTESSGQRAVDGKRLISIGAVDSASSKKHFLAQALQKKPSSCRRSSGDMRVRAFQRPPCLLPPQSPTPRLNCGKNRRWSV